MSNIKEGLLIMLLVVSLPLILLTALLLFPMVWLDSRI